MHYLANVIHYYENLSLYLEKKKCLLVLVQSPVLCYELGFLSNQAKINWSFRDG